MNFFHDHRLIQLEFQNVNGNFMIVLIIGLYLHYTLNKNYL